jgi:hypothetical protein
MERDYPTEGTDLKPWCEVIPPPIWWAQIRDTLVQLRDNVRLWLALKICPWAGDD